MEMNGFINLNEEQLEAVTFPSGPLLIVAGAGTGKTRVITERIVWLIESGRAKPGEILSLTFTEKAALEMETRVDERMKLGHEEIWISTFHSFCDRILREDGLEIGLNPRYTILTEPEAWLFVRENIFSFDLNYYLPLANPSHFIHALIKLFSRAKDENVTVSEYEDFAKKLYITSLNVDDPAVKEEADKEIELAKAYKKYQELCLSKNYLDFGDLQSYALKLLVTRASVLKKYQERFKYILVDEFQDTNYAQNEIVKLLSYSHKNITVCGDDDQSIYKFRGASISNIIKFREDFPLAKIVVLTKNYRSKQPILDSAYRLIQYNNPNRLEVVESIDKKLQSVFYEDKQIESDEEDIIFKRLSTPESEAEWVASEIENLVKSGISFREIAILARNNDHLTPFVISLKKHNIPYQLVGNRGLYDQEEIRDLIAYLKFLANFPYDQISLFHVMNIPALQIPASDVMRIFSFSRKGNKQIFDCYSEELNGELSREGFERIKLLHSMVLRHLELAKTKTTSVVLYNFLIESGYAKPYQEPHTALDDLKARNIGLFFNKINEFERESEDRRISRFVEYLEMMMDAGENPAQAEIEDIDVISLSTVHSAKGLEFPVVFLVQAAKDRFPTREKKDPIQLPLELVKEKIPEGDIHIQEERRLFYVGMTRAKQKLYITYAVNYSLRKIWKVSPFVEEALGEIKEEEYDNLGFLQEILPFDREKWAKRFTEIVSPKIERFSYSQLSDYEWCPRLYKLKNIMKIPAVPSHNLSFGQTMHETLQEFHLKIKNGEKASLEDLLGVYHARWRKDGYLSSEHEEKRKEEGEKMLKAYYEENRGEFKAPEMLEKKFSLKLKDYIITGRIDRIDRLDGGGYEILDYKTGNSRKPSEVDKDEQLTVYAMACKETFGFLPAALSLYFLKDGRKITTQRNEEQIEEMKLKILDVIEKIQKKEFPPVLEEWKCSQCEYRLLCRGAMTSIEES